MEGHHVPQRLCAHCSSITLTAERHCPWCGRLYGRAGPGARRGAGPLALAAVLLVHAALVLGGVYLIIVGFGDALETELDSQVERVERDIEKDLEGVVDELRRELRRELDARLPGG